MTRQTEPKSVLIVGAGIGGIATAARLAKDGFRVTVVEKNEQPGGRCGQMSVGGYRFDTGATFFMMPSIYAETFATLGERMEDHLDLLRVDPTYHLHFPDESQMTLTPDMVQMRNQMEAIEPGSYARLLDYLGKGGDIYRRALPGLISRDFKSFFEFINPRMIWLFLHMKAVTMHTDYVKRFFRDERLRMAFTFQDMYMGMSPFESPATYSLMQYVELAEGLYYPRGGLYRVTQALVGLAEKAGVTFRYNAPVEQVVIRDGRATGLRLVGGQELTADIVVTNADVGYSYSNLLPDDGTARRIDRMEYGCSTAMFYWGVDKRYPQLGAHNLFLNGDYRRSFEDVFRETALPETPNFYIHAPAQLDSSVAPAGHDVLYVAVPVGSLDAKQVQDWPAIMARARRFVLQRLAKLGIDDLEQHIKVEASFDPRDWQKRYNLPRGSVHGLSHKLTQMAYFRPAHRHARFRNLYFVGAGTHPGTGIPTVLLSARMVSRRIVEEN
jgi:phytoene desaturase